MTTASKLFVAVLTLYAAGVEIAGDPGRLLVAALITAPIVLLGWTLDRP